MAVAIRLPVWPVALVVLLEYWCYNMFKQLFGTVLYNKIEFVTIVNKY